MGDRFYRSLRTLAAPFAFRCLGAEHIARDKPAVFVANHLGSVGPIEAILSVPVRFYPWIRAEMMDHERGPRYLYDDFVHPAWHLDGRMGMALSRLVSRIAIAILHGIEGIPVEGTSGLHVHAFQQSLALLLAGRSLLIFPEDPQAPIDPVMGLRPFMGGFAQLCQMYERRTGAPLPLHPLAISAVHKAVLVGPAILVERGTQRHADTQALCALVRERVHALSRQLDGQSGQ